MQALPSARPTPGCIASSSRRDRPAARLLAAKDAQDQATTKAVIAETADLWFHCLVMLSHLGEDHTAVLQELERRFDLSGIVEKANRS